MSSDSISDSIFTFALLLSALRGATPLIFAAMAGLVSERSGVVQIALEGFMLIGAVCGATVAQASHQPWLGFFAAGVAGSIFALLMGIFVLKLKSDQIVSGTAINILAAGVAPFITKIIFDSTGSTPSLPIESRFTIAPMIIAFGLALCIAFWFSKTRSGLWLQFAGEAPEALMVAGINVLKLRWWALAATGFLAGLGGGSLSLFLASSFSPNMTAGRGFIALAALIFGRWKPIPTVGAIFLFALTDSIQIRLQGSDSGLPVQFIQILPYLVTIVALAGFFGRSRPPAALGRSI